MRTPYRWRGDPKNFTHIFHLESPKIKNFFVRNGKEDIGIPKICDHFLIQKWEFSIFLLFFDLKKMGNSNSQFFSTISRIPIF